MAVYVSKILIFAFGKLGSTRSRYCVPHCPAPKKSPESGLGPGIKQAGTSKQSVTETKIRKMAHHGRGSYQMEHMRTQSKDKLLGSGWLSSCI